MFSPSSLLGSRCSQHTMENNGGNASINDIQSTLKDVKLHLRWIYDLVSTGVKESRVAASDVKYFASQMGCHESRIDNND